MIDDLEALLQTAEREESKAWNVTRDEYSQELNVSGELKRIRRLLAAAPILAINGTGRPIFSVQRLNSI